MLCTFLKHDAIKYLYHMKQWLRFLFSKVFLKTAGYSVGFVVVVLAIVLIWMRQTTDHGKTVEVPDIRLMQLEEAAAVLESIGLTFEVIDSTHYVTGVKEGAVVELFPNAFAQVKLGRKIMLSTNPSSLPKYPLPNYKDQLVGYVTSKFAQKGFFVDSLILIPDLSHDLVLKVVDAKGKIAEEQEPYPTGSHFKLYVSGGQGDATMFLPNLAGQTLDQSKQLLMTYSLNIGALTFDADVKDSAAAFVYRQYPVFEADAQVPAGSSVDLWLTEDSTKFQIDVVPADTSNL